MMRCLWFMLGVGAATVAATFVSVTLVFADWDLLWHAPGLALRLLDVWPWFRASCVLTAITCFFPFFALWLDPGRGEEYRGAMGAYGFGLIWFPILIAYPGAERGDASGPNWLTVSVLIIGVQNAALWLIGHQAWNARHRSQAAPFISEGRAALGAGEHLRAVLAFSRALAHDQSVAVHLGLAIALERLGHSGAALAEYARAYYAVSLGRLADRGFAEMTDWYIRALVRLGGDDGARQALDICDDALARLRLAGRSDERLQLDRAFVLFRLGRAAEARDAFRKLASTAQSDEIRRTARSGAEGARLLEAATGGFEDFVRALETPGAE